MDQAQFPARQFPCQKNLEYGLLPAGTNNSGGERSLIRDWQSHVIKAPAEPNCVLSGLR